MVFRAQVDKIGEKVSWDLPGCEPPPPSMVEASGNRKSLLIGINYPGSSAELRGCINDVKRMKAYITSYDERVPGSSGKEG